MQRFTRPEYLDGDNGYRCARVLLSSSVPCPTPPTSLYIQPHRRCPRSVAPLPPHATSTSTSTTPCLAPAPPPACTSSPGDACTLRFAPWQVRELRPPCAREEAIPTGERPTDPHRPLEALLLLPRRRGRLGRRRQLVRQDLVARRFRSWCGIVTRLGPLLTLRTSGSLLPLTGPCPLPPNYLAPRSLPLSPRVGAIEPRAPFAVWDISPYLVSGVEGGPVQYRLYAGPPWD